MALIDKNPAQPVLPVSVKQATLRFEAVSRITAVHGDLVQCIHDIFNSIWTNGSGLTAQEAFDAFGTEAQHLRELFAAAKTFVNSVTPNTVTIEEPLPVTANEDGTVTVGS